MDHHRGKRNHLHHQRMKREPGAKESVVVTNIVYVTLEPTFSGSIGGYSTIGVDGNKAATTEKPPVVKQSTTPAPTPKNTPSPSSSPSPSPSTEENVDTSSEVEQTSTILIPSSSSDYSSSPSPSPSSLTTSSSSNEGVWKMIRRLTSTMLTSHRVLKRHQYLYYIFD